MISYLKKLFTLVAFLSVFFYYPVFADTKDVLLVNFNWDLEKVLDQSISLVSVEQKVLDESQIFILPQGSFKISLMNGNAEESLNYFNLAQPEEMEIFIAVGGQYMEVPAPTSQNFAVALVLSDFPIEQASLRITDKKDRKIILEKKLSDL